MKGDTPLTSTERARQTRRRAAARNRAFEVFANVVRLEADTVHAKGVILTERQARLIASRAVMNLKWLDDRLADLDAAADFFRLDENGRRQK